MIIKTVAVASILGILVGCSDNYQLKVSYDDNGKAVITDWFFTNKGACIEYKNQLEASDWSTSGLKLQQAICINQSTSEFE